MVSTLVFALIGLALVTLVLAVALKPLQHSMGTARLLGMAVALGVVIASLYMIVGTPNALNPQLALPATTMQDAVAQLRERVRTHPDDAQAWLLLAQADLTEGHADAVSPSLRKAVAAAPQDADILTQAAETQSLAAADHRISDEAMGWLQTALHSNAQHQRARWFLGIAQRQRNLNAQAAATWEPLLSTMDRSAGEALLSEVNAARQAAGQSPLSAERLRALPPEALRVQVLLPDTLRRRLPPEAAIFVAAKRQGQGMPVAAKRYTPDELPSTVYLTDADAPMPAGRLSQAGEVSISARVSMQGTATPAASDLRSQEVKAHSGGSVTLQIPESN
ncbi:tetratricopeptide repeat protein [Aquilutibacter rugosus]|uniref:tetratricopeptide repeat protein n=1 Tax=Aquilutibacter rugosus TaxID=3115820 RepID=UPI002F42AD7B